MGTKVSEYTELTTPAAGDRVPIVDVSDTSQASSGTTKYIQYSNMQTADITTAPTLSSGTAAPSSTPGKVGDLYVDTANTTLYVATGTTDSDDWTNVGASSTGATVGSGAPTSAPSSVGDVYVDTTDDRAYIAVGTASSDDWKEIGATKTIDHYDTVTFPSDVADEDAASAWRCPATRTLVEAIIWCDTAPTNGVVTVDLLKNGTTVFTGGTNRPSIAISGTSDVSGDPSVSTMAAGDLFQLQVKELHASDQGNIGQLLCMIHSTQSAS